MFRSWQIHSLLEQPNGLIAEHATGDVDMRERRLRSHVLSRQHNLDDLGRELVDRRGKDEFFDAAPQDRAHAHAVEGGALKRVGRARR